MSSYIAKYGNNSKEEVDYIGGCFMAKELQDILKLLPDAKIFGPKDFLIKDIVYDSRQVTSGALFICIPGAHVDGHDFINNAVDAGAVAVIVERDIPNTFPDVTVIKVTESRRAMQIIAPYFFDYPAQKMRIIGVTGTNGKTTTTHLIRSILRKNGHKVGLIGTIHTLIENDIYPIRNTTPDVIDLQKILQKMVADNIEYVVMEVSSHALALNRIAGCEFDVGVFTNITQDHLDFHGDFANYVKAKAMLFEHLESSLSKKENKCAVINIDDTAGQVMIEHSRCPVLTYGIKAKANVLATNILVEAKTAAFNISTDQGSLPLKLKITGIFNVYNVLAAVSTALAEEVDLQIIQDSLEEFTSVPGRFELVEAGQPFTVIVDYAHTPDGLDNVLKTAKEFVKGKLIVVFGCGGDRDRTKRPIMGKIAVQYADVVVATSDNPRSEDPEVILNEIEGGIIPALRHGKTYEKITDRRKAIQYAVNMAQPNDVILIAGKGHETYQILKDKTIDFDDRQVAREMIRELR